nr:hypothetical protein REQ54_04326 [Rhizobium sp. Q54]
MEVERAWLKWWDGLGHVARLNRDKARTREAFEAGYLAALEERISKAPLASGETGAGCKI